MSVNLLETVVQNLHYSPLHKIDPIEQEVKELDNLSVAEKLHQAAVPATLTAFSLFVSSEKGFNILADDSTSVNYSEMFHGKEAELENKIAAYSGSSPGDAAEAMKNITEEAVRITKQARQDNVSTDNVKSFIDEQRPTILLYLPASLKLGELLNYHGLDDRTHKMEGPMSNLAHLIEKKMSGSEPLK